MSIPNSSRQKSCSLNNQLCCRDNRSLKEIHPPPVSGPDDELRQPDEF